VDGRDKHGHDENRMRTETLLAVTIAADGAGDFQQIVYQMPWQRLHQWPVVCSPGAPNRAASPLVPSSLTGSPLPEAARAIAESGQPAPRGSCCSDRLGRSARFVQPAALDLVGEAYSHRRNWDRRGD
jgi:hypothetical protein